MDSVLNQSGVLLHRDVPMLAGIKPDHDDMPNGALFHPERSGWGLCGKGDEVRSDGPDRPAEQKAPSARHRP